MIIQSRLRKQLWSCSYIFIITAILKIHLKLSIFYTKITGIFEKIHCNAIGKKSCGIIHRILKLFEKLISYSFPEVSL